MVARPVGLVFRCAALSAHLRLHDGVKSPGILNDVPSASQLELAACGGAVLDVCGRNSSSSLQKFAIYVDREQTTSS